MVPAIETHRVEWESGESVTARIRRPRGGEAAPVLVLAHGAGTDQDHPGVAGLAGALAGVGLNVVTFNYPYTEVGRRAPDRPHRLLSCHRAVAGWVRGWAGEQIVLGGRSMGGRMASMLAAGGESCLALILYGYPLHPAGKPDRLRVEHLPSLRLPSLFFRGERDALSRADLFDRHIRSLPGVTVVDVAGADHSFRVAGEDGSETMGFLATRTRAFLDEQFGPWPESRA